MTVATITSFVFNKSFLKLMLALAIPTSIAYFFWYSQNQADKEFKDFQKIQKDNPISDKMVIENYDMKEVDDLNRIRWQLVAKRGTLMPNGKDVELVNVKVEYFDPATRELKMGLSAPFGEANQQTKYVKLTERDGTKVVAEGQGGKTKFVASTVELIKKNQFLASGGVIIDWPGVAKVSGDSASGLTDLSSGPKNFKVVGNTHAEIVMK